MVWNQGGSARDGTRVTPAALLQWRLLEPLAAQGHTVGVVSLGWADMGTFEPIDRHAFMGIGLRGVVAMAAVALAIVGCGTARGTMLASSLPPLASSSEPQPAGSTGRFVFYPNSGPVAQGVAYWFRLYTHCGLNYPTGPDFDGSFWDSTGAADDGSGNPPPGFGNPFDNGTMTLLSANLAEYRSSQGVTMRFTRHSGSKVASPCS